MYCRSKIPKRTVYGVFGLVNCMEMISMRITLFTASADVDGSFCVTSVITGSWTTSFTCTCMHSLVFLLSFVRCLNFVASVEGVADLNEMQWAARSYSFLNVLNFLNTHYRLQGQDGVITTTGRTLATQVGFGINPFNRISTTNP